MSKKDLNSIVQAAQQGDQTALNELFNQFYNDAYRIAMRETKSQDIACDVTQEAFIEIFQTIGKLKEPSAFVSWMKSIVYHQCTRYYKKKEVKHETLLDIEENTASVFDLIEEDNGDFKPDEALDNDEFKNTIRDFIDSLPDAQRSAVMMKYFDEMSVKQIAEIQGVPENTVLSRLNYGRKAIKKSVEDYEKKNHLHLHAVPFTPFLHWLFASSAKIIMPLASAVSVASAISLATGFSVAIGSLGVWGTIAALPLAIKIIGILLGAIILISVPVIGSIVLPSIETGQEISQEVSEKDGSTKEESETSEESQGEIPEGNAGETESESSDESVEESSQATANPISYTLKAYAGSDAYKSGNWSSKNVSIQINADSSVKRYYRLKGESTFQEYTDAITVSKEGSHTYEFKIVSDTTTKTESLTVNIDKTSPTASNELKNKYASNSFGNNMVIIITASETITLESLAHLNEIESTHAVHMSGSFIYGSAEGESSYEAVGQCSRDGVVRVLRAREWISNSSAYIEVNGSDSLSGIKNVKYTINGKTYDATADGDHYVITKLPNGVYDLKIVVTDKAGNKTEQSVPIKKDTAAPVTTVTTPYQNGTYSTEQVALTVSSSAGNASPIYYWAVHNYIDTGYLGESNMSYNGGTGSGYFYASASTPFTCEESTVVTFTACSEAGLYGTTTDEYRVRIDTDIPYLKVTENEDSISGRLGDPDSPIVEAYYALNGERTEIEIDSDTNRGAFDITLITGTNEIEIFAKNSSGLINTYSKVIEK